MGKSAPLFHIGSYPVWRIEEWGGQFAPPSALFAEYEDAAFAPYASSFTPDYLRDGMIYAFLQSFLINANGLRILVDTGAGNDKDRPGIGVFGNLQSDFLARLAATGHQPEDIDIVFCTHLHIDHVGWNTRLSQGAWIPTFPNATYIFPEIDRATWDPASADYAHLRGAEVNRNVFEDSVQPILDAGLAKLIRDGAEIAPGMTAFAAPGHTPGHVFLEVRNGQDMALFTGDILHHPMQVIRPDWNSVYCEDRAEAAATRRMVLERAYTTRARIVPAHFGGTHSIFVEKHNEGFRPIAG